jgi:hypothetical protein
MPTLSSYGNCIVGTAAVFLAVMRFAATIVSASREKSGFHDATVLPLHLTDELCATARRP